MATEDPTVKLQCPLVHLNGTSKKDLVDAIDKAWTAIDASLDAMREVAPNGRDYYPLGPEAMQRAEQQHKSRTKRLLMVREELSKLLEGIEDNLQEIEYTDTVSNR